MTPTTRDEFKSYCLRKLGYPVLEMNISDEQIDDRVDEALRFWNDYHSDGSERIFYKYNITPTDVTNKYLTLPDGILEVTKVYDTGIFTGSDLLFNVRYQLIASEVLNIAGMSMVPYFMAMQHLELIDEILNGQFPIRFNRHTNKLFLDCDWSSRIEPEGHILIECYQLVEPSEYPKAFSDRMLQNYCIQLIKQQAGTNLKKFNGMALPGGIMFNGQQMYDEATAEIKEIESEIVNSYSLPSTIFIG